MKKPDNKTAIITGSSRGLGAHIATSLAKAGFNLILNYNTHKKDANLLFKSLSKFTKIKVVKANVSNFTDAKKIVQNAISYFGRIDVLVNNAGIHKDSTVLKMTPQNWNSIIDTNLTGVFNLTRAVLPKMKDQHFGRIINISSFTAFTGAPGASNYSASKAGIIGFTRSVSKEVAKYNITVNAISPGYFDIGMFYDIDKKMREEIIKKIPTNRLGKPEEISELIHVLISSNYLTGQNFTLDGGFSS